MANVANAAKAFIVRDNKLLLVKRRPNDVQQPGMWEIPGGRLEAGEDPIAGVKREALEETGLDIEVVCPFSVRHFTRTDGQTITLMIFLCKPLGSEVVLSGEHTEFDWVPMQDAKDKIGEFFHKEIDAYNSLELYKQV